MTKKEKVLTKPVKIGHGIHRAKKTNHKDHTRDLKHEQKWIERKLDNK
jgi:hypothetical protein